MPQFTYEYLAFLPHICILIDERDTEHYLCIQKTTFLRTSGLVLFGHDGIDTDVETSPRLVIYEPRFIILQKALVYTPSIEVSGKVKQAEVYTHTRSHKDATLMQHKTLWFLLVNMQTLCIHERVRSQALAVAPLQDYSSSREMPHYCSLRTPAYNLR